MISSRDELPHTLSNPRRGEPRTYVQMNNNKLNQQVVYAYVHIQIRVHVTIIPTEEITNLEGRVDSGDGGEERAG